MYSVLTCHFCHFVLSVYVYQLTDWLFVCVLFIVHLLFVRSVVDSLIHSSSNTTRKYYIIIVCRLLLYYNTNKLLMSVGVAYILPIFTSISPLALTLSLCPKPSPSCIMVFPLFRNSGNQQRSLLYGRFPIFTAFSPVALIQHCPKLSPCCKVNWLDS